MAASAVAVLPHFAASSIAPSICVAGHARHRRASRPAVTSLALSIAQAMPITDSGEPGTVGGLIADATGALYGTTDFGGGTGCSCGTVFKLTPPATSGGPWTETVLYSFTGGSDGAFPNGLIADASGALYGILGGGGTGCRCGTVFKLTPPTTAGGSWTETVLYSFTGGADGASPEAGVIADATGALYGTTVEGGGTVCAPLPVPGCGTMFKLTPPGATGGPWTETVLHSFAGESRARLPAPREQDAKPKPSRAIGAPAIPRSRAWRSPSRTPCR
jgi:hypothetical protein